MWLILSLSGKDEKLLEEVNNMSNWSDSVGDKGELCQMVMTLKWKEVVVWQHA